MPFDVAQPYTVVEDEPKSGFDPSKPFTLVAENSRFDPSKPFNVVQPGSDSLQPFLNQTAPDIAPSPLTPSEPILHPGGIQPVPTGVSQTLEQLRNQGFETAKISGVPLEVEKVAKVSGEDQVALPRFGQEKTVVRGLSDIVGGTAEWALNNPEEVIASIFPPTQAAILLRYGPGIVKQFAADSYSALKGDKEALGRVMGVAALALGPKAAQEARARYLTEGKPAEPLPSPDEVARKAMNPAQAGELVPPLSDLTPLSKAAVQEIKPAPAAPEQAPETQAPTEPKVSQAEVPPAAATTEGTAPAITETTTPVREAQPSGGTEATTKAAETTTPTPAAQVEPAGAPPEIVGMGGASYGEVEGAGNPDVYGIAARVREQRAKAGQVAEVPPGEGISAPDSVLRGRELIQSGANPESIVKLFEETSKLSADDMAVARAHGEDLALVARRAEEKFGTDSPEYKAAWQALSDWDTRTKPMQTEWHKMGRAQQGETDIDTGSFTGLQRAYKEQTGKDFTPSQSEKAQDVSGKVKEATTQEADAKQALFDHFRQKTEKADAEKRALQAANDVVRENAARIAELERRKQVADAKRDADVARIQTETDAKVKASTDRAVKDAAIRAAKKEVQNAIDQAKREKQEAELQLKAEKKALDAANKVVRENAARIAKQSAKELELKADLPTYVWSKVRDYIERGMDDFDEIRNKVATDIGVSVDEVTRALAKDKRAKSLADDVWKKQQVARLAKQQAKRWVMQTGLPLYRRALESVPKIMFSLKVGFHGTVALGTHAPMLAFQPRFWAMYARDFGKMYRMVGSPTYYERQIQDLMRRPNYITARRAGLVNDPFVYEDYNSPDTAKYFGRLTGMGNRGYTVLKILRQDMFDQFWNKLPRTAQIQEMAEALSDALNHATGVVKGRAPAGTNIAFFAPRLEASRVMWLAGDPIRAADTFLRWSKATPEEKFFAVNQIKEKAWVAGTMMGMLAINQGILTALNSDQKINFDDPFKSDFLKFKAAGMNFSYGNAMLSMARLPIRLYRIRSSEGGKLKNLVYPDEDTYSLLGQYARTQLSPFASLATTLWLKADYANRPLPNSTRPMPKRLRAQGVEPYSWSEFWSEQVLPIPAEEAAKEVWKHGLGMDEEQIRSTRKALATIAIMSATGARLTEDYDVK